MLTVYRLGGIFAAMKDIDKKAIQIEFDSLVLAWKQAWHLIDKLQSVGMELKLSVPHQFTSLLMNSDFAAITGTLTTTHIMGDLDRDNCYIGETDKRIDDTNQD